LGVSASMGRVVAGSLIVEIPRLEPESTLKLLGELRSIGASYVEVAASPAYVYARRVESENVYQYGVAPLSMILPSSYRDFVVAITKHVYVLERDAWIDTKKLDLEKFLNVYRAGVLLVEEANPGSETSVDTGNLIVVFRRVEAVCSDVVYLDCVNAHYGGAFNRLDPTNSIYSEMLGEYYEKKPGVYVLSYAVTPNKPAPLLVYDLSGLKPTAIYHLMEGCSEILKKYLILSLIDLLLS